ncbi:MAG TPA: 30S ribosomal protein S3, partial [Xylella taiwanensis]
GGVFNFSNLGQEKQDDGSRGDRSTDRSSRRIREVR